MLKKNMIFTILFTWLTFLSWIVISGTEYIDRKSELIADLERVKIL